MLRQQNNLPKSNVNPVPKLQENQQAKLQVQDSSPQTNMKNQRKVPVSFTNEHSEKQVNDGQITSQSITFQPKKQDDPDVQVSAQMTSQNAAKKEG